MNNLLILLALVIIYFLFTPPNKSKKRATKSTPPLFGPQSDEESPVYDTPSPFPDFTQPYIETLESKMESTIESTEPKTADEKSYFTYETTDSSQENFLIEEKSIRSDKIIEIKDDEHVVGDDGVNKIALDFNKENFYRGIIFSEILKRPYS